MKILLFRTIVKFTEMTAKQEQVKDCHVQKVTVHAGVLLSDATALSSPRSPDVVLGERVLRMLISCPVCHRRPLTRSVFMFGTIEDTSNIIRTRYKKLIINFCIFSYAQDMHYDYLNLQIIDRLYVR